MEEALDLSSDRILNELMNICQNLLVSIQWYLLPVLQESYNIMDFSFSQTEFESYLNLLMPFYVEYRIEYGAGQPVNSNVLFNTGFLRPDDILTPDSYLKTYI